MYKPFPKYINARAVHLILITPSLPMCDYVAAEALGISAKVISNVLPCELSWLTAAKGKHYRT